MKLINILLDLNRCKKWQAKRVADKLLAQNILFQAKHIKSISLLLSYYNLVYCTKDAVFVFKTQLVRVISSAGQP